MTRRCYCCYVDLVLLLPPPPLLLSIFELRVYIYMQTPHHTTRINNDDDGDVDDITFFLLSTQSLC